METLENTIKDEDIKKEGKKVVQKINSELNNNLNDAGDKIKDLIQLFMENVEE